MGLAADVKALLSGAGAIFIGNQPDSPANCSTFFHTGGGRDLAGTMVGEPTFTILVRNTSGSGAYSTAETIRKALHGVTENGKIMLIEQIGDIVDLGTDDSRRHEVSLNFRALYRD
jgi:hypothetical protein